MQYVSIVKKNCTEYLNFTEKKIFILKKRKCVCMCLCKPAHTYK